MSNVISDAGLIHKAINFDSSDEVIELCHEILGLDNDLTVNEEYFREDTLELGFKSEAHRIVYDELEAGHRGTDLIEQVADYISRQEYYGACELSFDGNSVAFFYGGN